MNNVAVRAILVLILVGLLVIASKLEAAYKDPCNPYTTESTPQVVPGYYEDISGHCVVGDVSRLDKPTPHSYSADGMLFNNGYTPAWDNRPDNYYSNQQFSTSTTIKPDRGRHHGH